MSSRNSSSRAARLVGRDLRLEVAPHLLLEPDVGHQERSDLLVQHAAAVEPHRRDEQSLGEQLGPAHAGRPADVGKVGRRAGEADELTAVEDRRHHGQVGQVPDADPRVVGDDPVALLPVLGRVAAEQLLGQGRHQRGEGRDAARHSATVSPALFMITTV